MVVLLCQKETGCVNFILVIGILDDTVVKQYWNCCDCDDDPNDNNGSEIEGQEINFDTSANRATHNSAFHCVRHEMLDMG